jgi:hypothetical protein
LVWIVASAIASGSAIDTGAWPQCQTTAESSRTSISTRSPKTPASVARRLHQQLRRRAINIRLAGAGHPRLAHHRHRSAHGAAIFGEGFRPAADCESIETALRLDAVERQLQPNERSSSALIDLSRPASVSGRVAQIRCRFGGRVAGPVEQILESSNPGHRQAGESRKPVWLIGAGVKPVRMRADPGDALGPELLQSACHAPDRRHSVLDATG